MEAEASRKRAPRRGAYLIPSFFTMANVFCGYFALMETFKAGQILLTDPSGAALAFDAAAKAIGFAVLFDGLDGRIARLMGTTSRFGTELDSLADTITFGIAPAFLAFGWGVRAVLPEAGTLLTHRLGEVGWLVSFLFVICSAARLARFNIQSSPLASHPEHFEHKHFVGLPTPAAAGLVAAIVHANYGYPVTDWLWVPFWLLSLLATSFLMVSTWRYYSFKHLDLRRQQKFVVVVGVGGIVGLIWFYSHVVLLLIATTYVLSGVVAKLSHAFRRGRHEVAAERKLQRRGRESF
jgi:CDP-diacylglycerol--serine O-phosphatidyltransferase